MLLQQMMLLLLLLLPLVAAVHLHVGGNEALNGYASAASDTQSESKKNWRIEGNI